MLLILWLTPLVYLVKGYCRCTTSLCNECSVTLDCGLTSQSIDQCNLEIESSQCEKNCPFWISKGMFWSPFDCPSETCRFVLNCGTRKMVFKSGSSCITGEPGDINGCVLCYREDSVTQITAVTITVTETSSSGIWPSFTTVGATETPTITNKTEVPGSLDLGNYFAFVIFGIAIILLVIAVVICAFCRLKKKSRPKVTPSSTMVDFDEPELKKEKEILMEDEIEVLNSFRVGKKIGPQSPLMRELRGDTLVRLIPSGRPIESIKFEKDPEVKSLERNIKFSRHKLPPLNIQQRPESAPVVIENLTDSSPDTYQQTH